MAEGFRVWAPRATDVSIATPDGSEHPMRRAGAGWFSTDLPLPERYAFRLDGGPPRPDPRSPFQPDGVHGFSQRVDHSAYRWNDANWRGRRLAECVIYELHVGTFSAEGTYGGVESHLDHLISLGVSAVELMPLNQFSGPRGWGYDGVQLYAPHNAYGTPDELKHLVDTCHQRGLAVIVDVVYNHAGPDGNYLNQYAPYFTSKHTTPWGEGLNVDGEQSGPVRDFVTDNVAMWMRDYHMDGVRLDAVHAIIDESPTHILAEIADRVRGLERELGRTLWVTAESDVLDPVITRPREEGGYGLDGQWHDPFHHALHVTFTGEKAGYYEPYTPITDIVAALEPGSGRRPDARHCVAFLQNHDQVGNRPCGDRIGMTSGAERQSAAAAILLCAPFVPLIFQGEEWNASTPFHYFTSYASEELGNAVRQGRHREFAHLSALRHCEHEADPQSEEAFAASRLRWDELGDERHAVMLEWYRTLIAARRAAFEAAQTPAFDADQADPGVITLHHGAMEARVNASPGDAASMAGPIRAWSADVRVPGHPGALPQPAG